MKNLAAQETPTESRRARLGREKCECAIGVLQRAARYPELAEVCLLERDRLASALAEKCAAKKPARPVEVAA